jgi:predicted secreted protein
MLPVGLFTAIAIYIIWWWLALFMVLPMGVRSLEEGGVNADGHDQGAPVAPDLKKKALWATGLAAILWGATMIFVAVDPLNIR